MIKVTIGNNISRNSVIIDENTTLRAALEQQGIDYALGMTSLDGSTLGAGDLNKTFADFGVTEKCYLLNVVKADNAARIKIVGGACVVESSATLEQVKTLQKYRPRALCLYDEDGEMTFAVGASKGYGSVSPCGVSFGGTESNGKAAVTLVMEPGVVDPKAWVEDRIGVAILNLNEIETQFEDALDEVKREKALVQSSITVV